MIRFFKVYRDATSKAPYGLIYNFTKAFTTDIEGHYAINFNTNAFLKNQMTAGGEVKLPKGLWIMDIKFECNVVNTNNSTLSGSNQIYDIDFGLETYLNGVATNDRTRFLYNGLKNGICNYQFTLANLSDNIPFKIEFKPEIRRTDLNGVYTLETTSVEFKNVSLTGTLINEYQSSQPVSKRIKATQKAEEVKVEENATEQSE